MDTIIYFYKKRDLKKPDIEAIPLEDYLLLRVGLDVAEGRWFSCDLLPETALPGMPLAAGKQGAGRMEAGSLRAKIWRSRQARILKKAQRQLERHLRETQVQIHREIGEFLDRLAPLVDERYECSCVYADGVRKCLICQEQAEGGLPRLWQQRWRIPEFDAYLQWRWVEPLLKYATLSCFVVLGVSDSAASAVLYCARHMKSLRWLVGEKDYKEELEDFVEEFYREYGLAIALQILEGERAFGRLLLETTEPVCVLDFIGESGIALSGLARGSVWIDFRSVEEKARRFRERADGSNYFSMKEAWKRLPKP